MATRSLRLVAAICLISSVVLAQADIAGKWITEEQAQGDVVVLQLSVKGSVVTGAITVGESPAEAIADGKTDGSRFSFKTATRLNGKEVPILWDGELQDKKLNLVRSFGTSGRKLPPIVLQRSK